MVVKKLAQACILRELPVFILFSSPVALRRLVTTQQGDWAPRENETDLDENITNVSSLSLKRNNGG